VHQIRAITLDLDDTLWAISPVIERAEARLWAWLTERHPRIADSFSPATLREVRETVIVEYHDRSHDLRFLRKKVLERVATVSGYSPDLVEPAFRVFDEARNEVEFYPDVMPALEQLAGDFPVIAVTNGNANLDAIGIRHLFHAVVAAADAGFAKPARPIFDKAIARAGCRPEQVLHVGDHPQIDIDGAREAGLRTAWINRSGAEWPAELPRPDAIITSITELQKLLEPAVQSIRRKS